MDFHFEWAMVTAIVAVVGTAAAIVSYIVRNETKSVRDLVILDRETVKLRISRLEITLEKVEVAVVAIADFKWQLKLVDERLTATGTRLDELTKRFNTYSDARDPDKCPAFRRNEGAE